jgi:hypothetical protein
VAPVDLAQIGFRTVAGIGRQFPGLVPPIRLDLSQHRGEVLSVGSVVGQLLCDDDLAVRVDSCLRIVGLLEASRDLDDLRLAGSVKLRWAWSAGGLGAALPLVPVRADLGPAYRGAREIAHFVKFAAGLAKASGDVGARDTCVPQATK